MAKMNWERVRQEDLVRKNSTPTKPKRRMARSSYQKLVQEITNTGGGTYSRVNMDQALAFLRSYKGNDEFIVSVKSFLTVNGFITAKQAKHVCRFQNDQESSVFKPKPSQGGKSYSQHFSG